MKKIYILFTLGALAAGGLTSCNPDKSPTLDTTQDFKFVLNTPPLANQLIDLSEGGNLTFTLSQPEYGLTLAPNYGLQISLKEDFTSLYPDMEPDEEGNFAPDFCDILIESQIEGVLIAKMSNFAIAINRLNGVFNEEQFEEKGNYTGPVYVRATASVGSGLAEVATSTISNVITLANVVGYADFGSAEQFLYCPGNANGWSFDDNMLVSYDGGENGDYYHGFVYISGTFKFCVDSSWPTPGNYGIGDVKIELNNDMTYTLTLVENGADFNQDDIMPAGLYWVTLNVANTKTADGDVAGTATMMPITYIGITGDFNNWTVTDPVLMDDDGGFKSWTANGNFTASGWKFIFNNDWTLENTNGWTVNLGGTPDNLILDGDNLYYDATTVTLDVSHYPWTCTIQ